MSKRDGFAVRGAAKWLPLLFGTSLVGGSLLGQTNGVAPLMAGDCSVSSAGAVVCTKTNGAPFAASATTDATNAGNIGSGTMGAARLPAGRVDHMSYTGAVFGDSYDYGSGSSVLRNGYAALMKKDTPTMAGWLGNFAVVGTTMPSIAQSVLTNATMSATYPSTWYIGGGENDYPTCPTGTASCVGNFSRSVSAAVYWGAIAPQQRTLMSNVSKTGTWSNNTSLAPVNVSTGAAAGSAVQSTASGSTLSFTVPAGNAGSFGIYVYTPTGTAGGSYTVSVDGTLQTDPCNSGASTFNAFGCGGVTVPANGPQRIRFAVGAGSSHSVVITTSTATAATFIAWDYSASVLPANTNAVILRNAGAAYDTTGWTATAAAGVVAQARADGLTTVMLSDARSALAAVVDGSASGGVSQTFSPVYGAGSTAAGHPRDTAHVTMEQAALAAEVANGYIVSAMDAGVADAENFTDTRLTQWADPYNPLAAASMSGNYRNLNVSSNYQTWGVLEYGAGGASAMGHRVGSGALPDGTSNAYHARFTGSYECVQKFTAVTSVSESNFTNTYCVNGPTGNALTKGQFQSYLTTGAGFHGVLFTPASSAAACVAGDFADDANYHYVCTAANTWKRAALSAF